MKKIFNTKTLSNIIIIFVILQSLIDLDILISNDILFGFTIPTLFRLIGIFVIGIILILSFKFKKYFLFAFSYLILILIYFYFHHKTALGFNSLIPNNYYYSIFEEIFYIIRLLIPIFMIFATYFSDINEKKIEKLVFLIPLLISGTIVISNILVTGLGSYNNEPIVGSIFNWFSGRIYDFYEYASKGWFSSANAISSLLVLLFPLVLYYFIKSEKKLKWSILVLIQMLSMFMLGTKVATWGIVLELVVSLIAYIFFIIIKKEFKFSKKLVSYFLVFIILYIIIYPYSPCNQRKLKDNMRFVDSSKREKEENKRLTNFNNELELLSDSEKENYKIEFISKNYVFFSINPAFIENSYNYRYDPDFWISIFKEDYRIRTNYRLLEERMFIRLKEIDNRSTNDYLGLTFSRLSKVFTLEKDFLYQYYTLGYIGLMILIFTYFYVIIYSAIKMLFIKKREFRLFNISVMMGSTICLASAYMSGNILDTLMITILLGFFLGLLLKNMEKDK